MQKLSSEEINEVKNYLDLYPKLHADLDEILNLIQDLEDTKNKVVKEIEDLREKESKFILELENKYGIGEIDIKTLSYKKTD